MTEDEKWMNLACDEAMLALGQTSPNPLVGAIAVKNGKLLSKGHHHKAGLAHAEVDCLKSNIDYTGATLYVTLEPCSTSGRTPPCTKKIIEKNISRVVIGTLDPNPEHAGAAIKILKEKGIEVTVNVAVDRCWKMNLGFFKWIRYKKPYVILKMAMTLDGKIATKDGQSKWITGPEAREKVQELRKWCGAIMVGGETVINDNCGLTVNQSNWQQPQRLIWSSRENFPKNLKVFNADGAKATIIKPTNTNQWNQLLDELGQKDINSLLLEGGGELAANALAAGIVDQVSFFIAPKILLGRDSRPVVAGDSPFSLDEAISIINWQHEAIGSDLLITGYTNEHHQAPI
jgi:diaminohydroxyphosphoribosylaminopyrimidine deaminase / 5-amino-6-(5-phosphoribosylamino)uracil reductase